MSRMAAVLVVAFLLLSGCYRYLPTDLQGIAPGGEVRVQVSRRALVDLPEEIPSAEGTLQGQLLGFAADSLRLRVPVTARIQGPHRVAIAQEIRVPVAEVLDVTRREFNGAGTALAVAGGAGAATALVLLIMEASGRAPGDDGPPPDQIRIPLLSVTFP